MGEANLLLCAKNLLFEKIFAENYIKWKTLDREEGRVAGAILDPPM